MGIARSGTYRPPVEIFDILGQRVRTLLRSTTHSPGQYSLTWDGTDDKGISLASGSYIVKLEFGEEIETRQLTLLR
ncbi:MAG: T9SS type A sorting domain-containing protein [Gemmatimonadetes bacterium]|nr:T9SS type A sorting domain-containing protein [Gemmatimonadota bacterium]